MFVGGHANLPPGRREKTGLGAESEVRYPIEQIEGMCWDGRDLVLVAEGGPIF